MRKRKKYLFFLLLSLMAVPVTATNYTESVTYKPAPDIVEIEENKDVIIYDEKEDEKDSIPSGEIIVTPISEVERAKYEDIHENFLAANDQIQENSLYNVCPTLENVVVTTSPKTKEEELVVKDLFHLALYGTYKEFLEEDGSHIYLTFKVDIPRDKPMYVMFCADGGKWNVIDPKDVVRNDDGTITIRFDQTGAVAFIMQNDPQSVIENSVIENAVEKTTETKKKKKAKDKKKSETSSSEGGIISSEREDALVTSPQTGYEDTNSFHGLSGTAYLIIVIILFLCILLCLIISLLFLWWLLVL